MLMKRILVLLTAALVMAAIMVALAAPAFAAFNHCTFDPVTLVSNCSGGEGGQGGGLGQHRIENNSNGDLFYAGGHGNPGGGAGGLCTGNLISGVSCTGNRTS